MRRKWTLSVVVGVLALTLGAISAASGLTVSALEGPGRFETWMATRAKQWLIRRDARSIEASRPAAPMAMAIGEMRFRGECAPCHGNDGRSPTDIGRGLYPRAVDLGSPTVQAWSDRELFWIIKHGVRLTGMPAFGAALDDDEIGALVTYVRSLAPSPAPR